MLTRLWSLLRALFRRPAPTQRETPGDLEPPPPAPAVSVEPAVAAIEPSPEVGSPAPEPSAQPLGEPSEEEDEDEWADEEAEEEPDDEPDPFITGTAAAEAVSVDTQALRAQARAEALSGEHRIYLSSPAGPGSLAEALNLLLEEGSVEAQFVQVGDDAPYILYRPVG